MRRDTGASGSGITANEQSPLMEHIAPVGGMTDSLPIKVEALNSTDQEIVAHNSLDVSQGASSSQDEAAEESHSGQWILTFDKYARTFHGGAAAALLTGFALVTYGYINPEALIGLDVMVSAVLSGIFVSLLRWVGEKTEFKPSTIEMRTEIEKFNKLLDSEAEQLRLALEIMQNLAREDDVPSQYLKTCLSSLEARLKGIEVSTFTPEQFKALASRESGKLAAALKTVQPAAYGFIDGAGMALFWSMFGNLFETQDHSDPTKQLSFNALYQMISFGIAGAAGLFFSGITCYTQVLNYDNDRKALAGVTDAIEKMETKCRRNVDLHQLLRDVVQQRMQRESVVSRLPSDVRVVEVEAPQEPVVETLEVFMKSTPHEVARTFLDGIKTNGSSSLLRNRFSLYNSAHGTSVERPATLPSPV